VDSPRREEYASEEGEVAAMCVMALAPSSDEMAEQTATRFNDLLMEAVVAIQAMVQRGKGWDEASAEEKGRAVELGRGIAGERRYAKQVGDEVLLGRLDALKASAEAQLRMLEGRTTPGDEELATRLTADASAYAGAVAQAEG
jgi:hypothetical protein